MISLCAPLSHHSISRSTTFRPNNISDEDMVYKAIEGLTWPHFTNNILKAYMPRNLGIHNSNAELRCRMFLASLSGTTFMWFHRLPSSSISSYEQLRNSFIPQFAYSDN